MTDRALTEAEWKELCTMLATRLSYSDFPLFERVEAELFALRAVAAIPREPTEAMVDAAHHSTSGYLNLPGSQMTVNREKGGPHNQRHVTHIADAIRREIEGGGNGG